VIHFRLAELLTEVELLRALAYQSGEIKAKAVVNLSIVSSNFSILADIMLKGEDVTLLASMLKLKSGRLAREVTDSCLQVGEIHFYCKNAKKILTC
jgi:citronellyl-CoA dehydrogenase